MIHVDVFLLLFLSFSCETVLESCCAEAMNVMSMIRAAGRAKEVSKALEMLSQLQQTTLRSCKHVVV